MKVISTIFVLILTLCSCQELSRESEPFIYPKIEKQTVIEDYCGVEVVDDYRNLENLKDPAVEDWFGKQEEYTKVILDSINGRDEMFEKMKGYSTRKEYEISSVKVIVDGQYFYQKQLAEDDGPSVYMKDSKEGQEELIFDPKEYRKESQTNFVIRDYAPSWDGEKVAIALTHDGKGIAEVLVMDTRSKKILVEGISNFWGDLTWFPDNSGIFFMALSDDYMNSDDHFKEMNVSVYKLGAASSKKEIVLSQETNPELNMTDADIPRTYLYEQTDKYVIGEIAGATAYSDKYYCRASNFFSQKNVKWSPLAQKENKVRKIRIHDGEVIALTAQYNQGFQIVKSDVGNINWSDMNVIATPKKGEVINDFVITSEGIFYTTLLNGVKAKLYHIQNNESIEISLPTEAGSTVISNLSSNHPELWLRTRGWLNDYERYSYLHSDQKFVSDEMSQVVKYPEFDDFVVREVEVEAHDGELIPLSIVHRKDIKMDGTSPTLLEGYGAYGLSYSVVFSPIYLTWVEYGGIMAIAHVRGGSEKGNEWYEGGKKKNKPNTWKDMISCAEYMIDKKYTTKNKTVIRGGSAGGITAGRSITDRPDLFAAAIIRVGALNALRSEDAPNGENNVKEFGSYKNPDECMALLEMDSYNKIKSGVEYPATIITAGLNDPLVVAWSPGKFAARLQERSASVRPILFYVQSNRGHGLDADKWNRLEENANLFSFALWQVGHEGFSLN